MGIQFGHDLEPDERLQPNLKWAEAAAALLEEYENRLKAQDGTNVDPQDYVDRYPGTGRDREEFIRALNLSTLLTIDGILHRQHGRRGVQL